MMMYDELVKALRLCALFDADCKMCPRYSQGVCYDKIKSEAADAIEELSKKLFYAELSEAHTLEIQKALLDSVKIYRWIPVTERLPEEEGKYLTVFTNTIQPRPVMEVCCYAKDLYKVDKYGFQDKKRKPGFYQYDSEWGFFEMSDISHWMPLPEPPKDGEE